jgi:hypothetical protein
MVDPGAQFKFNKKDKKHVNLLKKAAGNDELTLYPSGLMSTGMKASPQVEAQKNSESKPARKTVAPRKSKIETKVSDSKAKKTPNFLAKARDVESSAKKRGAISEGLKNKKTEE